jgi:hypothetical protein
MSDRLIESENFINELKNQCEDTPEELLILDEENLKRMVAESDIYKESERERKADRDILRDYVKIETHCSKPFGYVEEQAGLDAIYDEMIEEEEE